MSRRVCRAQTEIPTVRNSNDRPSESGHDVDLTLPGEPLIGELCLPFHTVVGALLGLDDHAPVPAVDPERIVSPCSPMTWKYIRRGGENTLRTVQTDFTALKFVEQFSLSIFGPHILLDQTMELCTPANIIHRE